MPLVGVRDLEQEEAWPNTTSAENNKEDTASRSEAETCRGGNIAGLSNVGLGSRRVEFGIVVEFGTVQTSSNYSLFNVVARAW